MWAISAETGKTTVEVRAARRACCRWSATGGGLVFGGDANGHFALRQKDGKVLWEMNLGSPVSGYPITFAVGGKQYVAVITGPSLVTAGLNALTPELQPQNGSSLFVFALPANSPNVR